MQQQIKHFNCCYHDADDMFKFMQFLLKFDKSIRKHLSSWRKQKGCHGNSFEIPMQRRSVRMRAKDGGALPDSGCPTIWRQGNEEERAKTNGHGFQINGIFLL